MICLICRQAEIVDGVTLVVFERGECKLIVKSVLAQICPVCGEAYVEEAIAVKLLNWAKQKYEAGIIDMQSEYGSL
ncbi:MAG TPA: type II toxin-antitoxin system MqsA family antitoxin [Anaerolineales bacterium]|jgi:YgiT-type zinc finger domain-containing protein|nr:type II toxin-antitoxin system MqsA family antitoxin [Anaerolineales bacterium]